LALGAFLFVQKPGKRLALLSVAAAWAFLSALVLMSLFFGICSRYQFEFLPPLALLAALGALALEATLSGGGRVVARCLWIPALLFSAAFTVLYGVNRSVEDHSVAAIILTSKGDLRDANHEVQILRMLSPGDPFFRVESGVILVAAGHLQGAENVFSALARDYPDYPLGRYNLARVLETEGKTGEAIVQLEEAHQLAPENPAISAELKSALAKGAAGTVR
jgi:tetratricopeptide (TPR) repeat protein